jgi:hypothetical protein
LDALCAGSAGGPMVSGGSYRPVFPLPAGVFALSPAQRSKHSTPWIALLIVNPHVLCCLLRPSLTEAPSLRLPRYYGPLRHPIRPGRSLASCQLILTAITAGASRVASGLLCVHAIAITPAGSMEPARSCLSIDCGLPCVTVRSAPAIVFSRPAQRSLMLWPARSRSR